MRSYKNKNKNENKNICNFLQANGPDRSKQGEDASSSRLDLETVKPVQIAQKIIDG